MLLSELVETSRQVAATRSRRRKSAALAACLRTAEPELRATVCAYLAGTMPQGRIGLGWRMLAALEVAPQPQAVVTVAELDACLSAIAAMSGAGSKERRLQALSALLARATEAEQHFVRQLVLGELRQGALAGLMLEALAQAAAVPLAELRRAFMLAGDLGAVAEAAQARGSEGLAGFALELFRPLLPMLAKPASDVGEVLGRMDEAAFEFKLDGARVQVHKDDDEVRVYTRQQNEISAAVPELVEAARALPRQRLILDGEAIALRPDGGPQPFQVTMERFGRRRDVAALRAALPLSGFFFDCLYADRPLIDAPGRERLAALDAIVPEALRVPRRSGWLSNLHLGARDPAGGFVMLGKAFKGLSDELLAWQTERLLALETHREQHVVWVRPALVVEIAFGDVQRSSQYPGGLALRFARVKGYRADKDAAAADTIDAVRALHSG